MKNLFNSKICLLFALLMAFPAVFSGSATAADVCSQGVGIPPFLSGGADPNLLLLLDNSGSMLDMAYIDDPDKCTDKTFDATKDYTGLFDPDKWYKWTQGVAPWKSGTKYSVDNIVYAEGIFYKAVKVKVPAIASIGFQIADDTSVDWAILYQIPLWAQGATYSAKSFVQFDNQLYYTADGGTANDSNLTDGVSIGGDTGVTWVPKDSTWMAGATYATGDIVSYEGMLFKAATAGVAAGTSIWENAGVTWTRLDEGYFEEAGSTKAEAITGLSTDGDLYQQDDLYVRIVSVGDVQSRVSAFAASGKMLNWASASKFDIQKKILTGGKYNPDADRLISQHRGCSGKGFVKEIPVNSATSTSVLTFSIKGTTTDNWIDTTDDTLRITIMGISSGFIDSTRAIACQFAVDCFASNYDTEGCNQGTTKTALTTCLDYGGTNNILAESNSAYNHSVHACWEKVTKNYTKPSDFGNVSEVQNSCEHVYRLNIPPTAITPENSGYMCYGGYNSLLPDAYHDADTVGVTGSDRLGYIGRCWKTGAMPAGCEPVPCTYVDYNPDGAGDISVGGGVYQRCLPDGYTYSCNNYNTGQDECKNGTNWVPVLQDTSDTTDVACTTTAVVDIGAWSAVPGPNDVEGCIQSALWDYCQGMTIPEVIDPSDDVMTTETTWGMVGALIDSGIVSQFGSDHALIVMKGYIKKDTQPQGILHSVAPDLRIGVMAFNDNGAATECLEQNVNDTIVQYCPADNQDGASLIAPIKNGDEMTGGTAADPILHVDDLTVAINKIRATAWTPLSEAVYTALGYYGQKGGVVTDSTPGYKLNADDYKTAIEDSSNFPDPVQYWCQENYLLLISEGASTADINPKIIEFITAMGYSDPTVATVDEKQCSELYGSTYLDDLTYFGQHATAVDLFTTPSFTNDDGTSHDKQNLTTYIVTTGIPNDDGTTDECSAATLITNAATNGGTTLLTGEDPAQLEKNLKLIFSDILSRASAGSAASVISSSRSGEGGVYQAIFWPQVDRGIGETPLAWTGDVHAFFIDGNGFLWDDYSGNSATTMGQLWSEDKNGNGILDAGEDANGNGSLDGDRRVITFFNNTTNTTQICFNSSVTTTGVCSPSDYFGTTVTSYELRDFGAYLWSANKQLQSIPDISTNRTLNGDGDWDFSANRRYVFTWNDLDNDGIVDADESLGFVSGGINTAANAAAALAATPQRSSLLADFNMNNSAELDGFVEWFRGDESSYESFSDGAFTAYDSNEDENMNGVQDWVYRCRRDGSCAQGSTDPVWRLGDIIHSTPTLVAKPAEGYHYIYSDPDYALFYKKYLNRRHVVYFGANDGMLHAVNAGFYLVGANTFLPCNEDQRDPDDSTKCVGAPYSGGYPALGDELWAYVPYNLQKHLKCLANPDYSAHKYFVDGPPRVFDVRIFADDDDHPGGWGTILVGYMRFGGSPVRGDNDSAVADNREFVSSYFILDVTNPEKPPKLLAEMTMTDDPQQDAAGNDIPDTNKFIDMGYTTSMPAMVAMRDDSGRSEWFLLLGNGSTELSGENNGVTFSNNQGRIAVVPLNSLTGMNWKTQSFDTNQRVPFRIPNTELSGVAQFGKFSLPNHDLGSESFISDMVTVDFDIGGKLISGIGAPYKTDVAYFGTTDGTGFIGDKWNGGGRMFRLLTNELDGDGNQKYTYPGEWELKPLLDAKAPITAAPNVGYDGDNFWVYFGTGRFYTPNDKTDDTQQYFFGLKEPVNRSDSFKFTWAPIDWWSGAAPRTTAPGNSPGTQGLLRVDPIKVIQKGTFLLGGEDTLVYCQDESGVECSLPITPALAGDGSPASVYYPFASLENYIRGEHFQSANDPDIGIDGWYRELTDPRERTLGMPTLLGGLTTFTSYQPSADLCTAEGRSFLYAVYSRTGTAWYKDVIGINSGNKEVVRDRLDLGKGLATTPSLQVGTGGGATAFIQTSTGEIIKIKQEELPFDNYKSGRQSWRNK